MSVTFGLHVARAQHRGHRGHQAHLPTEASSGHRAAFPRSGRGLSRAGPRPSVLCERGLSSLPGRAAPFASGQRCCHHPGREVQPVCSVAAASGECEGSADR